MKRKREPNQLKSVEISCVAPDARQVCISGTFNEWNPSGTPMSRAADGSWHAMLELPPGSYEYKFVVDGQWVCEPGVDDGDPKLRGCPGYVSNSYGSMNRKLQL